MSHGRRCITREHLPLSDLAQEANTTETDNMKLEDLRQAILDLSDEERLHLMMQLGPDVCRSLVQQPAMWQQMMAQCQAGIDPAEMPPGMQTMMEGMMARMAGTATDTTQQAAAPAAAAQGLEPAVRELAAIAAAVAGHCQPCFAHHHQEALALGVSPEVVQEVIGLARQIHAAGDRHHDEFIARRVASSIQPDSSKNPS